MFKLGFWLSLLSLAIVASPAQGADRETGMRGQETAPAPPPPTSQPVAVVQPAPPAPTSSRDILGMAGVVVNAVGIAGLVTGFVLNLKTNSMIDDVQNRYDGAKYSSSKDYKTASQVAYAAGGVCVVGGLVLSYLAVYGGRTAVAPVVVQGGAGALLTGAF